MKIFGTFGRNNGQNFEHNGLKATNDTRGILLVVVVLLARE